MVFHSFAFLTFLFLFAGLYVFCKKSPWVLLAANGLFYATLAARYLPLLVIATVGAYFAGLAIGGVKSERQKVRRTAASVVAALALLAFFKYAALRTAMLGAWIERDTLLGWALPVGMSYYLFKIIGYLVDVYWERIPPEKSLLAFAVYTSFFPQIVCGPIQRPGDFLEQLRGREVTPEMWASGLRRILFGLFTKLVVAGRVSELVDPIYAQPRGRPTLILVYAVYLFSLQLYADFSALTSISIGAGRLFGVTGPENFDAPYLAGSLPDLWRRWHMSLTSWLTDYVYTPVRHALRNWGDLGLVIAILVNMVAVGVWHGERLSYLVFGLVNGALMAVAALTQRRRNRFFRTRPRLSRARAIWAPIVTFHLITLSFVWFRAPSLGDAWLMFGQIGEGIGALVVSPMSVDLGSIRTTLRTFGVVASTGLPIVVGTLGMMAGHHVLRTPRLSERFRALPRYGRWAAYYAAAFAILFLGRFEAETYIYAQF